METAKCTRAFALWFLLAFSMCLGLVPTRTDAHRPGESYVYLVVREGPLEGEFHVRFSDMNKAVPLDVNGDGIIDDAEVLQRYDEVSSYLAQRLRLFDQGIQHDPVPGELEFFGPSTARQLLLHFSVPTINPPSDELGAAFDFLYNDIDTVHRPMLLLKSNTRMRLKENEAVVSLVFEPGADRQIVSLLPPPFFDVVHDVFPEGLRQITLLPNVVVVVLAAFLGCLRWRANAQNTPVSHAAFVSHAAVVAAGLSLGFVAGVLIDQHFDFRWSGRETKNALATALGLAALSNLLVRQWILRGIALICAGALCGATSPGFNAVAGLNKGLVEIVLPAFASGVFAAFCLLAAALLPAGSVLIDRAPRVDTIIRNSSVAVVALALIFVINRLFIQSN